jgi:hypothetical protein
VSGVKLLEPPATGPLMLAVLAAGLTLIAVVEVKRPNGRIAAALARR